MVDECVALQYLVDSRVDQAFEQALAEILLSPLDTNMYPQLAARMAVFGTRQVHPSPSLTKTLQSPPIPPCAASPGACSWIRPKAAWRQADSDLSAELKPLMTSQPIGRVNNVHRLALDFSRDYLSDDDPGSTRKMGHNHSAEQLERSHYAGAGGQGDQEVAALYGSEFVLRCALTQCHCSSASNDYVHNKHLCT